MEQIGIVLSQLSPWHHRQGLAAPAAQLTQSASPKSSDLSFISIKSTQRGHKGIRNIENRKEKAPELLNRGFATLLTSCSWRRSWLRRWVWKFSSSPDFHSSHTDPELFELPGVHSLPQPPHALHRAQEGAFHSQLPVLPGTQRESSRQGK